MTRVSHNGSPVWSPVWGLVWALCAGSVPALAAPDCLRSTADLRAVLALPGAAKSGRTYCLAPGRYTDLRPGDFAGAFDGIDPARPVVFEAQDPADPPVLNMWVVGQGRGAAGDRAPAGNLVLRDLAFTLTDMTEVPLGENGFGSGHRNAVQLGVRRPVENVTVERIRVTGPLREGRLGGRETARIPIGVTVTRGRNVTVRDSRFERVLNGLIVSGTDITLSGNRMRHSWGDLVRVVPQVLEGGRACAATERVVVRNNVIADIWGNNRMHPDMVQMFAANRVSCDVRDVLIEGNIAYPGVSGMQSRPYSTGMGETVPGPAPPALAADKRLHRLTGPGETRLPVPRCAGSRRDNRHETLAVQLEPGSAGPVILRAPEGSLLNLHDRRLDRLVLDQPWETWRFTCSAEYPGQWQVLRQLPSMQGVFTNRLPDSAGYHDITVRHNIIWATAPAGVRFSDPDQRGITVQGNSILRPWPGDLDGDGQANGMDDGFNTAFAVGRIILEQTPGLRIEGNVTNAPLRQQTGRNDAGMTHTDSGRAMIARFPAGPGPELMPRSLQEAVALARPRAGGKLDGRGIGALATRPADDPYDWSWTATPW